MEEKPIEQMFKDFPDIMNVKQIQEALGIGKTLTYKLLNTNAIESMKIGKVYRVTKINLIKYVHKDKSYTNTDNSCYNVVSFESRLLNEGSIK